MSKDLPPLEPASVADAVSWLHAAGNEEVELGLPLDVGRSRRDQVVGAIESFVLAYPQVSFALMERPLAAEMVRIRLVFAGPARDLEVLIGSLGDLMRKLRAGGEIGGDGIGITARRIPR